MHWLLRPRSDLVAVPGHGARALKWTLFRHVSARNLKFQKQQGKNIDCREIGNKFRVGASTACRKANTADTDENLFILVPGAVP